MTLYIFNPDTDYALAVGSRFYTPTKGVIEMRKSRALLPVCFAAKDDAILLLDNFTEEELANLSYYQEALEKKVKILTLEQLEEYSDDITKIVPWGWNQALRYTLSKAGINERALLSEEKIDKIRELSHRRTCLPFRNRLKQLLPGINIKPSAELCSLKELEEFLDRYNDIYIKFPWSSSGRGVMKSRGMRRELLFEWAAGSIRRQGSVIAEEAYDRNADFASEWICKSGKANFLGLSYFYTAEDGRYELNSTGSQEEISNEIITAAPLFNMEIISAQKKILEEMITPFYDGPVGIDMLSEKNGNINPCVEINMRLTMGHRAIALNNK